MRRWAGLLAAGDEERAPAGRSMEARTEEVGVRIELAGDCGRGDVMVAMLPELGCGCLKCSVTNESQHLSLRFFLPFGTACDAISRRMCSEMDIQCLSVTAARFR